MNKLSEKQRSRLRRLRILQQLEAIAPNQLCERTLFDAVNADPALEPTIEKVRRSLGYMADLGLVELQRDVTPWSASIKAAGIDYLEGDGTDIKGIAHPEEFMQ